MFVSPVWQAWRVCTGRAEILQGCAGLGAVAGKTEIMQDWAAWPSEMELLQGLQALGACPGRDCKCLWIPDLNGLFHGGPAVLRGGSLG
jgi:hypothetical protein